MSRVLWPQAGQNDRVGLENNIYADGGAYSQAASKLSIQNGQLVLVNKPGQGLMLKRRRDDVALDVITAE